MNDTIVHNFTYHAPKTSHIDGLERVRSTARLFATLVDEICPHSREKSLAITKIEEAVMWANAAIVRY